MLNLKRQPVLALLALSSTTLAQTYNVLAGAPACAQSCSILTSAQSTCNSDYPSGPFSDVSTCFCTDGQISTFGSNPALCPDCTGTEATAASQWFAAYCAQPATITGAQAAAATAGPAGAAPATVVVAATSAPASSTAAAASATNSAGVLVPVQPQSWWHLHARWIAMVIALVVAFAIIIAVGVFWKRRYDRKQNAASSLPPGSVWGPVQRSHPSHARTPPMESNLSIAGRSSGYGIDFEKGGVAPGVQRTQSDMSMVGRAEARSQSRAGGGWRLKKLVGR